MISATRGALRPAPEVPLGALRAAAGEHRPEHDAEGEADEVLDVPQQARTEQHRHEVGAEPDPHPSPPHRLHHRGEHAEQREPAGRDPETAAVAELDGPRPSAVVPDPQEQGGQEPGEELAADGHDEGAQMPEAALVDARHADDQCQDRHVQDGFRREEDPGEERPPTPVLQCGKAVRHPVVQRRALIDAVPQRAGGDASDEDGGDDRRGRPVAAQQIAGAPTETRASR
jgi:hypothetical protein